MKGLTSDSLAKEGSFMGEQAVLSIIVPVYNLENYLCKCIDSILGQTYRDFEVLLVDDGSTDSSLSICLQYAETDSRICVFHKDNGGASSARNLGLEKARGQYISFIDGDDFIEPDLYERLLEDLLKTNADISCCQLDRIDRKGKHIVSYQAVSGVYSVNEIAAGFFEEGFIKECMYGPYQKLFRAECIGNNRFKPYQYGEDLLFVFKTLGNVKTVYLDDYIGYHYVIREGSAVKSSFSPERLDYVKAARDVERYCEKHFPQHVAAAHRWVYRHALITLRQLYQYDLAKSWNAHIKKEKKYLKSHTSLLPELPLRYRFNYLLVMYCPFLIKGMLAIKRK